jgi:lambda repressor-like predicted transcriptional regulator
MSMHSRKYLRIEGDLATLVTEVTEREVALDDLLNRLAEQRSAISGMLPAGCRFWIRSPEGREVFVVEQLPMRRQIEYHASNRYGSEPVIHRLALPYVVFVVSTAGGRIESLSHFFRTSALRSLDDPLEHSCLPNTSDDGIVCLGTVHVGGDSLAELIDGLITAFWSSRFNADIRRHPLPFSGGFRAWASRSRRDPMAGLSATYDRYWRNLRQIVAAAAGMSPEDLPGARANGEQPQATVETPSPSQAPAQEGGGTDAAAA